MPVLYRDYRPKNFSEVINQENIKTTLQKAVASGFFAHAYLFTGPRGTGKTSVARILARAINCPNQKNGEPCNSCDICKSFLDGTSLDLIEIDAASNTGVENVRDIIEHLKFSPTAAKYKVFIIDEVHMLSKGAFNALLKTLEEPPQHAVFILATTEIHKVPATVISRTQRFDFKKIDNEQLAAHLAEVAKKEKIKIDADTLELIVNASEGSVRDALSILDKLSAFDKVDLAQAEQLLGITNVAASQKFLDLLAAKDAKESLNFLQNIFSSGVDPIQFNRDFLEYLRKVLMLSMGAEMNFPLDQTQKENLQRQSKSIKSAELLHIIRLFLRANKDFAISPNLELPMEIAAAENCLGPTGIAGATAGGAPAATGLDTSISNSRPKISKAELSELSEASVPATSTVSFEQISAAWPEIMQQVKQEASSMFAILRNCELKEFQDNILSLTCKYKFHKDALENTRNYQMLVGILERILGAKMGVRAEVDKSKTSDAMPTDSALLEAFGNELM